MPHDQSCANCHAWRPHGPDPTAGGKCCRHAPGDLGATPPGWWCAQWLPRPAAQAPETVVAPVTVVRLLLDLAARVDLSATAAEAAALVRDEAARWEAKAS